MASRASGESPESMLKMLKAPAKSSCASGIGIALVAPRMASMAAASRFEVMGNTLRPRPHGHQPADRRSTTGQP